MKRCARCQAEKPATEFTKNKKLKDGLGSYCLECNRERSQQYHTAHKAAADPRRCYKCQKWKPLSAFARSQKKADGYRSACKECDAIRLRDYVKQPHIRKRRTEQHNKKARLYTRNRIRRLTGREVEGCTDEQWRALRDWFGNVCLACGSSDQIAADHVIPLELGGIDHITNLQPLCKRCNSSKATRIIDYRDTESLARFLRSLLPL